MHDGYSSAFPITASSAINTLKFTQWLALGIINRIHEDRNTAGKQKKKWKGIETNRKWNKSRMELENEKCSTSADTDRTSWHSISCTQSGWLGCMSCTFSWHTPKFLTQHLVACVHVFYTFLTPTKIADIAWYSNTLWLNIMVWKSSL